MANNADILIRGMEMPKDGSLWLLIRPDGTVLKIKNNDKLGLPKEGAAIFLPEGHGDLIDRDAFRAENGLNAKCEHCPTNTYECQHDMIHTKMEFCGMLDDAPVIVPAEGGEADGN